MAPIEVYKPVGRLAADLLVHGSPDFPIIYRVRTAVPTWTSRIYSL